MIFKKLQGLLINASRCLAYFSVGVVVMKYCGHRVFFTSLLLSLAVKSNNKNI